MSESSSSIEEPQECREDGGAGREQLEGGGGGARDRVPRSALSCAADVIGLHERVGVFAIRSDFDGPSAGEREGVVLVMTPRAARFGVDAFLLGDARHGRESQDCNCPRGWKLSEYRSYPSFAVPPAE